MRSGSVGLIGSQRGKRNGEIIDRVDIRNNEPVVLSLNFITKRQLPYLVKSLQYCSYYYLKFSAFIDILKNNYPDFLHYSLMRDKIKNIPDEFEVFPCSICQDKFHYKFDCPLIHHFSNKDQIIFSYLRHLKRDKN